MSRTDDKIRMKPQKALMTFTNKQFARAFENLITAEKNIHLGERKNDLTKYASASGYVLSAMENLVSLRYAFEELRKRYHIVSRDCRRKKREIKSLISSLQPEMVRIEVPEWLYKGE